jgi:glycosidase
MNGPASYHFHVSRAARERYGISRDLFSSTGNVVLLDLHAARTVTQRINEVRTSEGFPPENSLRAGDMNAMGLIDEILHYVVGLFRARVDPQAFTRALASLDMDAAAVDACLDAFSTAFPPAVAEARPAREVVAEEMLLLALANADPAFAPFTELFDEASLVGTDYRRLVDGLEKFFTTEPTFGPDQQALVEMLRSPVRAAPTSLAGQLEFIRTRWGSLLGDLLLRLLTGIDLIHEEERARFGVFTPGPPEVYEYAGQEREVEAFSADRDWMPYAVMIAKNALVWLGQLSRAYGRDIRRLDQVPDEELARLKQAGFSALWLIGVWERSGASREIKRRMGNPEAEASAYSLFDYDIAAELGGKEALEDLKMRAWRVGIRLASDMVPNHTGVDSRWMAEHPERFLAWPHPWPPFPAYTFSGPNVSQTPGIGVYLEDHYWDKTDAAVVFKRVDFASGESRLYYHGNDGTHMPWNDTAQLDFLNPETREAVIQVILRVARMFPIIRFDAAMTLAKKHFHRLWYPEPGSGGDIPSRAGNGLSRHDFDRAMPVEFWREVVDRVAKEAPDTLLLAEAFWLLEGFFVRTLGMHRVYNSAFMHMLKDEDNAGYRQTMRNTMEFDPEVLKRFVNFMSNPDEQTAIEQFGDGDKYFGVCTLMATLPGLPMFAHGQLEGLREKYGMEFRRAYWEETPNAVLMDRHEREIFPLLRRRRLFAGVESFLLYDFFAPDGHVNEDVFAYSNQHEGERSLVLYNNRYSEARGWVRMSAGFAARTANGKEIVQRSLAEGLGLPNDGSSWVVFRDQRSGLQYIRNCQEIWNRGMHAELGAYRCQVFLDFSVLQDGPTRRWAGLAAELDGRGVPSMDAALREREYRPVRVPFGSLLHSGTIEDFARFLAAADARVPGTIDKKASQTRFAAAAGTAAAPKSRQKSRSKRPAAGPSTVVTPSPSDDALVSLWRIVDSLRPITEPPSEHDWQSRVLAWLDEWMLAPLVVDSLSAAGWERVSAEAFPALLELSLHARQKGRISWEDILGTPAAAQFLRVNTYDGVRWFRKESLETLAGALPALARALGVKSPDPAPLVEAGAAAGYRWEKLLELVSGAHARTPEME